MSEIFDPQVENVLRIRAKAALRKRMRALRASIPAAARAERCARIIEKLSSLPEISRATYVGLFWPILERAEIDLRGFDRSLRAKGKVIGFPCVREVDGKVEPTLRIATPEELEERGSIYLEPPSEAPELPLGPETVIVVPALSLTPEGDRLGYGIGFYDRLLARALPEAAFAVAVAFDFQILGELPTNEGDVRVSMVVTD